MHQGPEKEWEGVNSKCQGESGKTSGAFQTKARKTSFTNTNGTLLGRVPRRKGEPGRRAKEVLTTRLTE